MLEDDVTKEELEDMFSALPVQAGTIDALAFRDLLERIDGLFDPGSEQEAEEGDQGGVQNGEGTEMASEGTAVVPEQRDAAVVMSELLHTVASLQAKEGRPCSLSGTEQISFDMAAEDSDNAVRLSRV
eukprot:2174786-Lingulodinium_polyedra.AAC.1